MLRKSSNAYVQIPNSGILTDTRQIEMVAKFGGVSLHKIPKIADVEHEV